MKKIRSRRQIRTIAVRLTFGTGLAIALATSGHGGATTAAGSPADTALHGIRLVGSGDCANSADQTEGCGGSETSGSSGTSGDTGSSDTGSSDTGTSDTGTSDTGTSDDTTADSEPTAEIPEVTVTADRFAGDIPEDVPPGMEDVYPPTGVAPTPPTIAVSPPGNEFVYERHLTHTECSSDGDIMTKSNAVASFSCAADSGDGGYYVLTLTWYKVVDGS
jgi:hypothetical protein